MDRVPLLCWTLAGVSGCDVSSVVTQLREERAFVSGGAKVLMPLGDKAVMMSPPHVHRSTNTSASRHERRKQF